MFKVVPDQLRISAGWVRCGVCAHVFDAGAGMLPAAQSKELEPVASLASPAAAPSGLDASPSEPVRNDSASPHSAPHDEALAPENLLKRGEEPPVADSRHDALDNLSTDPVLTSPYASGWRTQERSLPVSRSDDSARFDQAFPRADALLVRQATGASPVLKPEEAVPEVDPHDFALSQPQAEQPKALQEEEKAPGPESAWPSSADSLPAQEEQAPPVAEEVPSFVREARRKAFWRSRGVRAVIWLVVVLGGLGLGLQWTIDQRDWLAAREPRLTPLLEQLCRPVGCTVEPYRNLNAIVIDGSSFQRGPANAFQLSFTLRNNDDVPVATPSLELTLTDAQDQMLSRRALRAQDFSASRTLPAHGEFTGTSAFTVDSPDPSAIVGYRVMAFYP